MVQIVFAHKHKMLIFRYGWQSGRDKELKGKEIMGNKREKRTIEKRTKTRKEENLCSPRGFTQMQRHCRTKKYVYFRNKLSPLVMKARLNYILCT